MPSYYEADSPLWDQLVLRLDEHQLSYERTLLLQQQTQKHQQHKQKRSASQPPPPTLKLSPPPPPPPSPLPPVPVVDDRTRNSRRESTQSFKTDVPWTRKAFARLLFMDNADFRKFASAFVMTDPFTLNALRFHAAYSDLCTDMSDALGDAYQLALPRHTAPSFGIARFLSPICPRPTAPPLSVPTHLVPRFRTLWNTYLNDCDANSQTYLATSLRSEERAALRLAINGAGGAGGDRVWCGVLDESVAKILEDVYRGAFAAFVERYGYSPLQHVADARDGYDDKQDSVVSSSPPTARRTSSGLRISTQQQQQPQPPHAVYHHYDHYPSPATTPSSVVSSSPQLRYSSSRRDSIYSDTMMPTSPSRASTTAMPAVPPRASSLRPPPVWAVSTTITNGTTSTSRHSSARSSSAGARKLSPVYAAPTTTAIQDIVQRDSGVSVGSSRTGKR
ncbi:hypothetical protein BDZ88DRAFT_132545 [Geranomyces variabilis]|nr:hypothetical protein BDZ88DRAFT_132545 [Geranomyces variabilis]KAJ3138357.1 hypothetical protein HDU90_001320 [Geranomyces variabilis]